MRHGLFGLIGAVLWMCLLNPQARPEGSAAELELTCKVQEILHHHCLPCHAAAARGGVRILDRAHLVEQRQVLRPGSPEASELLDLVEGGSMPPGKRLKVPLREQALLRRWIKAGAPALPGYRDDSYVLWSIARDWERLGEKQTAFFRYLSLSHLADGRAAGDLERRRETLERVLHHLMAVDNPAALLESIEQTGTVFRIDLRRLGWNRSLYNDEKGGALNLFDLVLLEYPDGRLPTNSPFYSEVLRFLKTANQVRPISHLRADWFVREVTRAPLYADFLAVLNKKPDSKPPEVTEENAQPSPSLALVAHWNVNRTSASSSRRRSPLAALTPNPLADEETSQQPLRGRQADLIAPDERGGVPIVPLDGLTYPEHNSDLLLTVAFRAIDFDRRRDDDPRPKDTFVVGERMALWIKPNEDAFVEVVFTDKTGRKIILYAGEVQAGKAKVIPAGGNGIRMQLEEGEKEDHEEHTLYAYRLAALKAGDAPFPRGRLLRADKIRDRIVHPLYQFRPDGKGFGQPDADKLVKTTIRLKTIRADRKKD